MHCNLCLQPFKRRYLQVHQSDCLKRPFACQHCNQHEATFEEVTQSHCPVCPSFPLPCPNNCDLVLQRQDLEQHISLHCSLTVVHCIFQIVGCGEYLRRRDMPFHINQNIFMNMSLLERHMSTPSRINIAACMWLMMGTIRTAVTTNQKLQESHEQLCWSHDQLSKHPLFL